MTIAPNHSAQDRREIMEFLEKQIAPPATWEVFENLARALFAAVWEDPHAQKNGRSGQAQHGVDVYGEPKDRPGAWHGWKGGLDVQADGQFDLGAEFNCI